MDGVGTQQGDVHRQRQGTGLATVLGGNDYAVKAYISQAEAAAAERKAAKEAAKKAADDALTKMKDFTPEFWFAHDAEMKGEVENWHTEGAALLAKGTNPWSGLDEQSVQWRKKASRIKQEAAYSMQLKQYHDATRTKILDAPPGKYTDESIAAQDQYWNGKSLGEFVDNPLEPPLLVEKKPLLNAMNTWNEIMAKEQEKYAGREMTEAEIAQTAQRVMQDTKGSELAETYNSQLAQMDPAQKTDLQARAVKNQRNIYAQMAFEDAQASLKQKEPFSFKTEINKAVTAIEPTTKEWQKGEKSGKAVDLKELKKSAETQARLIMANRYDRARAMAEAEATGVVPRDPGATDAEYAADVEKYMANEIYTLSEKSSQFKITSKGEGEEKLKASAKVWIEDLYSSDRARHANAASHLQQMKLFGMETNYAEISTAQRDGKTVKILRIGLEGMPKLFQERNGDDPASASTAWNTVSESEKAKTQEEATKEGLQQAGVSPDKYEYVQEGTTKTLELILDEDTRARFEALFQVHGKEYVPAVKNTDLRSRTNAAGEQQQTGKPTTAPMWGG